MRSRTIAFTLGVWCLQQCVLLPSVYWLTLAPLLVYLLTLRRIRNHLALPLAFALGFLWALFFAVFIAPAPFPETLEGEELVVEGIIDSLPVRHGNITRFEFQADDSRSPLPPGRYRLSWYGRAAALGVGQRWRLKLKLKRAHGMYNPGGFDYEGWLYQRGIRATGYVRKGPENRLLADNAAAYPVQRWRQQIRQSLDRLLAENPYRGLFIGLAIGERDAVSREQWQVLRNTGTSHLLAISGLHVGLVAGLFYFACYQLWRLFPPLLLQVPAMKAAAVAALCGATVYSALAGFSIPTRRALIMIAVLMLARMYDRSTSGSRTLLFALLLVVLADPLSVIAVGFWLSFAAVAVIIYGMGNRLAPSGLFWRWGRVQFLIALGFIPLLGLFFQQVSLISPLANTLAVPWLGMSVVPLALLGALLSTVSEVWASGVLTLATLSLDTCWRLLSVMAGQIPVYHLARPGGWLLVFALMGVLWLLAPRGWPVRWLGSVALLPLFVVSADIPEGGYRFTMLDVGQGLATVIETRHHTLVYDTGPRFSATFDTGAAVVTPFLRSRGVGRIDTLVVSHGDNDHAGGVRSLLERYPVERMLGGAGYTVDGVGSEPCRAGQQWRWDGVHFEVLHPKGGDIRQTAQHGNDGACVLKVTGAGGQVLLAGDIETAAETELVRSVGDKLKSTLLIAPHHGSKTSSSTRFIDAVDPQWVLYSTGYRNRFGFPHPDVARRYQVRGVRSRNTAASGAIEVTVMPGSSGIGISEHRKTAGRYWNRR